MTIESTNVKKRTTAPAATKPSVQSGGTIQGTKPGRPRRMVGVLFGPPKSGKTTAATTGKNVLLVSFDPDGDTSTTLANREDILVVRPRTQAELDSLVVALHTTDRGRFDWVVVDSLTFLFLMIGGKEITDQWKSKKDVRSAYGRTGAAVQQFVHDLVMLEDTSVIFTAHLDKEGDEDSIMMEQELGESEVKVAVTPMVWRILGPAVSFIGRTYRGNETVDVVVDGKKKRRMQSTFMVSFDDGERSPAGSRLTMDAKYKVTQGWLQRLADELIQGGQ